MYSEKKQALAAELSLKRPAVLAVSGAHNSGKTTLLEKLIPLLRARGLKVGVIKHDGHDFTPDVPGTDSFRLREAGAEGVAVFSGSRYLLTEEFRLNEQDLLALFERHGYDLVLMDVCTKGSRDGIDVAAEIKARYPETKVIIITSMVEESYLKRAKAAGAESFWYKDVSPESLLEVMDRTMAGESLYPDRTPETRLGQVSSTQLTPREIEVLRLVCEGLEYEEIAAELGISSRTVKRFVSSLLEKTGYSNRTRLAIAVTKKNFILPHLEE